MNGSRTRDQARHHDAFLAGPWARSAGYGAGALGGIVVAWRARRSRALGAGREGS